MTEVPAPSRIAPHAYAVTADVISGDEELATGRFVLLHDPSAPEAWDGEWRCVTFARAEVETELATDPMVGVAGWSWLTDALHERELTWLAEAGTVTRVVSEGFGGLSDNTCTVDMEIRASWTPVGPIADHFTAWTEALTRHRDLGRGRPCPERRRHTHCGRARGHATDSASRWHTESLGVRARADGGGRGHRRWDRANCPGR